MRVPCYIGDLRRDPNLENYTYKSCLTHNKEYTLIPTAKGP